MLKPRYFHRRPPVRFPLLSLPSHNSIGRLSMERVLMTPVIVAAVAAFSQPIALAQEPNVTLHVNTRWKSCAIQLDSSLSQSAWHKFAQDVGVVAYFRP